MVRTALMALGGAALAGLLGLRLADGSASSLVQSWYLPVLLASALILGALALAAGFGALRTPGAPRTFSVRPTALLSIGLVAGVIVLGLAFKPEPLGSASLQVDDSGLSESFNFSNSARADSDQRNVYQWAYEFATAPPVQLSGQAVDLIGFVHHPGDSAENRFTIARFVVACCVADAQGFTLPVEWPEAETLAEDRWIHLVGTVEMDASGRPVIRAQTVDAIAAPSNPYIYP